ncbi:MAG: hypothetical protein GKR89_37405 [Candidatus Latescibacteria bacterium]|nr:hypothetical protein [Candidatus Latescibacterota bacterium]
MEVLYGIFSWGSPLGLALFFFFSGIGTGVFFWGLSHLGSNDKEKEEKT